MLVVNRDSDPIMNRPMSRRGMLKFSGLLGIGALVGCGEQPKVATPADNPQDIQSGSSIAPEVTSNLELRALVQQYDDYMRLAGLNPDGTINPNAGTVISEVVVDYFAEKLKEPSTYKIEYKPLKAGYFDESNLEVNFDEYTLDEMSPGIKTYADGTLADMYRQFTIVLPDVDPDKFINGAVENNDPIVEARKDVVTRYYVQSNFVNNMPFPEEVLAEATKLSESDQNKVTMALMLNRLLALYLAHQQDLSGAVKFVDSLRSEAALSIVKNRASQIRSLNPTVADAESIDVVLLPSDKDYDDPLIRRSNKGAIDGVRTYGFRSRRVKRNPGTYQDSSIMQFFAVEVVSNADGTNRAIINRSGSGIEKPLDIKRTDPNKKATETP